MNTDGKEEIKLYLLTGNIIVHIETKNLLKESTNKKSIL